MPVQQRLAQIRHDHEDGEHCHPCGPPPEELAQREGGDREKEGCPCLIHALVHYAEELCHAAEAEGEDGGVATDALHAFHHSTSASHAYHCAKAEGNDEMRAKLHCDADFSGLNEDTYLCDHMDLIKEEL